MHSIMRKPKVLYRICNNPSPLLVQSQINSVNVLILAPSYFLKIHFNIILPFMPMSSNWPSILRLPHEKHVRNSHLFFRVTCLATVILLDLIIRIILKGMKIRDQQTGETLVDNVEMVINTDLVSLSALYKTHNSADGGHLVVGWLYLQK
jgi:Na+/phosphate symporter